MKAPDRRLFATWAALLLLLGAALLSEREFVRRAAPFSAAAAETELLLPPEESAGWRAAAITLAFRGQEPFLYVRSQGRWRCVSHYGAPVPDEGPEKLLEALGRGQLLPRGPRAAPASYGLGSLPELRIELHGPEMFERPDRHVLFGLDAGLTLPQSRQTFVRRDGDARVHTLDVDLFRLLESPPGVPPLVDTRILPPDWPGRERPIVRIELERATGAAFTLERFDEPPRFGPQAGEAPELTWELTVPGVGVRRAETGLASIYVVYLLRAQFSALLNPAEVNPDLATSPEARLRIEYLGSSDPLELWLLPPLPDGRRVILQSRDRLVLQIEPEQIETLFPAPEGFRDTEAAPPWDRLLGPPVLPAGSPGGR